MTKLITEEEISKIIEKARPPKDVNNFSGVTLKSGYRVWMVKEKINNKLTQAVIIQNYSSLIYATREALDNRNFCTGACHLDIVIENDAEFIARSILGDGYQSFKNDIFKMIFIKNIEIYDISTRIEIKISRQAIELMHKELEVNIPYMACGLLIGNIKGNIWYAEKAVPINNIKRITKTEFELDPAQHYDTWNNAAKDGKEIVAIYYTQNSPAALSDSSRKTMEKSPEAWIIIGNNGMKAYIWEDEIKTVRITEYH